MVAPEETASDHTDWRIAQLNVARALYDTDDPRMADFMNNLDRINGLAEQSRGFVWRFQDESGNATGVQATPDPRLIINMSVWESIEALHDFAYKSDHTPFIGRRHEWFERPTEAIQVMWWLHVSEPFPYPTAGLARLQFLRKKGPGPNAFTFKHRFDPPQKPPAHTTAGHADTDPAPAAV